MQDSLTTVYAVRQESTGLYLADVRGNHTSATPETLERSPGMPHGARLSTCYQYVSARRVAYVKGEARCATEYESDGSGFGGGYYYRTEPQWGDDKRDPNDFAVVAFALVPLGRTARGGKTATRLRLAFEARASVTGAWRTITEEEYRALGPTNEETRRIWIEENCE